MFFEKSNCQSAENAKIFAPRRKKKKGIEIPLRGKNFLRTEAEKIGKKRI
jgi:hypothetical protein